LSNPTSIPKLYPTQNTVAQIVMQATKRSLVHSTSAASCWYRLVQVFEQLS